jgi:beta-glucanase (GH16 family)
VALPQILPASLRGRAPASVALLAALLVSACGSETGQQQQVMEETGEALEATTDLVWAINVGGPAHEGIDGTRYEAETSVDGGAVARLEKVKGSQDAFLYRTYREGDINISRAIDNGVYDITFHFAEPEEIGGGERLFDALIEGNVVIDDLDVMVSRDGKTKSALTVVVPNVQVNDGELNIGFAASQREPILSALAVRNKKRRKPGWSLVWSDEFDYEGAPDPAKWTIDEWPARKVNDEDQAYTARPENLRVTDGHLVIEAHLEDFDDARYTSGRVHSQGKGDLLYGRVEARAWLPRGKGTWAAIWMLPTDPFKYATTCEEGEDWQGSSTCDAWPKSGEIDILEHVGYQMGHVHGTVHSFAYYWINWEQRKGRILVDDVADAWHVYAMEWTPDKIEIFVDDALYFTYINEGTGWEAWPFDHPYHVILNVAVGGMWGRAGGGIDDSIFPQRMLVDYVRMYEATD